MTALLVRLERPSPRDPRWLILAFLGIYDLFAMLSPSFNRSLDQWLAATACCLAVELAGAAALGRPARWLSALITGLGIFILCDAPRLWPYAAVALISSASKFLIRHEHGHVFNPSNFGMTLAVLWLPHHVVSDPSRWGAPLAGTALIAALGWALAWRAGRMTAALAYQGTFIAGALLRAWLADAPLIVPLAPVTGPAFQLYSFYMITDPATSPRGRLSGAAFGAAVGLLDSLFRHWQWLNAPLYALFAVTAAAPALASMASLLTEQSAARRQGYQG